MQGCTSFFRLPLEPLIDGVGGGASLDDSIGNASFGLCNIIGMNQINGAEGGGLEGGSIKSPLHS